MKKKIILIYKVLFNKNFETINIQNKLSESFNAKYKKSMLTNDRQGELLNRIVMIMEDNSIICNPDFSVDMLAELVHSNQKYVSQVINDSFKKNFRSFLNSYRIKEAQLILSEPDAIKYTIESVALQVGFRSRNAFRDVFKEFTGISPNSYLKSMYKQSVSA